jgi:hypothetical protein
VALNPVVDLLAYPGQADVPAGFLTATGTSGSRREGVEGEALWQASLPGKPVAFGKVDRDYSGQLDGCEALGYPVWQGSAAGDYRDLAELNGTIRAAAAAAPSEAGTPATRTDRLRYET